MGGTIRRYEQVTIVAELDGKTAEKHCYDVEVLEIWDSALHYLENPMTDLEPSLTFFKD